MPIASAKITSKGQITLPSELRRELGVKPGDRVDFTRNKDGKLEMTARTGSIMDIRGIIKTDIVLSDKELEAAISDSWGNRWHRPRSNDGEDSGL